MARIRTRQHWITDLLDNESVYYESSIMINDLVYKLGSFALLIRQSQRLLCRTWFLEESASRISEQQQHQHPGSPPRPSGGSPPPPSPRLFEPTEKFCSAAKSLWADPPVRDCFDKINQYAMDKVGWKKFESVNFPLIGFLYVIDMNVWESRAHGLTPFFLTRSWKSSSSSTQSFFLHRFFSTN